MGQASDARHATFKAGRVIFKSENGQAAERRVEHSDEMAEDPAKAMQRPDQSGADDMSAHGPSAFVVGVTGQRPEPHHLDPAVLERRCLATLSAIARGARGCRLVALSSLREGGERAFAEAALTCRYELRAVLPCDAREYETSFTDPLGVEAYRRLLSRASAVVSLGKRPEDWPSAERATGDAIAAQAAIILALWDGAADRTCDGECERAARITDHVVEHAFKGGTPVIWIDVTGRHPRRLLLPHPRGPARHAGARPADDLTLDVLKRRTKPCGRQRCITLARALSAKPVL